MAERDIIVAHGFLADIEDWIRKGWRVCRLDNRTAVQRAYGACYYWRYADA